MFELMRKKVRLTVMSGVVLAAAFGMPDLSHAQVTAFKTAVAETASQDESIAEFYRSRGFEPFWTGSDDVQLARRAALIKALDAAGAHGLPAQRYDPSQILSDMQFAKSVREQGVLDVELTKVFLRFARDLQSGILDPRKAHSDIKRAAPVRDANELLEQLATNEPNAFFRTLAPTSHEYRRLMREKMRLTNLVARGGWGDTVGGGKIEPGQSGARVVALRNRLIRMGYLPETSVAEYETSIVSAVQAFQLDHGLEADGVAGDATLKALNVSAEDRLKSVLVAMERERWLNQPEGWGQRHIKVNLTEFMARIYDDQKVTFETRAVVGARNADRRTPEFSDIMEFMVVNPSWYVPRSIVVKEYLPLLRSNPGAVGHLEITDSRGRKVNRGNGFSQYSAQSFPFAMRQPPGPRNALGLVKFMFPNKYNIYLHDTPAKSLFQREVRAYSHGCVRLNDPFDFAYTLLAKQESDPVGVFQSHLRTGRETRVNLETPVPVHLIYRTAFTQAKGRTQYRDDIYGRDAAIWSALERAGVALISGES